MFLFCLSSHLFSEWCPQFRKPPWFLFSSSPYLFSEWCPQFCNKLLRFISVYCQFAFLSGACVTTDVGRTFRRESTLVREVRTTAVSRRLRKTDWCFYSVFVKVHHAAPTQIFYHSIFRINLFSRLNLIPEECRKHNRCSNDEQTCAY